MDGTAPSGCHAGVGAPTRPTWADQQREWNAKPTRGRPGDGRTPMPYAWTGQAAAPTMGLSSLHAPLVLGASRLWPTCS
jgi:hypothetical protein